MTRSRETGDVGYRAYKKNLIINGSLATWQRGTNFPTTDTYKADRWRMSATDGAGSIQRVPVAPDVLGLDYSMQPVTSSGTANMYTALEFVRAGRSILATGKTYTLSAWVALSGGQGTGDLQFTVTSRNSQFDATNQVVMLSAVVSPSVSGYTRLEASFVALAANGTNEILQVTISGIPYQAVITGIQLEEGSSATPFEYVSPQENLAACQRYFERIVVVNNNIATTGQVVNTSAAISILNYTVKRATPTVTFSSGFVTTTALGAAAGGTPGADITGLTSARISMTGAAGLVGGNATCLVHPTSGFIDVDAEL